MSEAEAPGPEDDPLAELARREPGDPLALGKADAPVVMIELRKKRSKGALFQASAKFEKVSVLPLST